MEKITFSSLAKVNLGLEVGPLREDGYHQLTTLFQTVNLKDRLSFEPRTDSLINLAGNRPDIPWDESNLIYRSALLLRQAAGLEAGVNITVEKNIPPGRGLAGGSSNAAVTLLALNRLWGCNLEREKLQALAAELGADVPFFLYGGLCLGTGKGEKLQAVPELPAAWVLLIIPDFSVSTALAYREFDRLPSGLTSTGKESKIIQFLEQRNFSFFKHLRNDLELAVFKIQPRLVEIKKELAASGAELSMLSGSGSAVFGWFEDWSLARQAAGKFDREYQVWLVETVGREQYWQELNTGA
ncbi:MAG: 4-(cytidine 5'-diphospho)-2-C-methyl-D-erythritol kinase [Candidatus Saccharicenans sp.]|nr:4-(cytidine 5'-diphospho)-2-C-methyl-D-erythritol kinase [Candidatus Saccharicenans sp.]MDI6848254.1 4-(cytidine 5'-diphospho)-2-C-methyl-D-erythritol kinase [Candidatus Saccharicenans sp.]